MTMPLIIENQEHFDKVRAFAERTGKLDKLQARLDYLDKYNDPATVRCKLFRDFAPASFEFVMEKLDKTGAWAYWFNGGLIYHGSQEGWGSTGPTFSVTLSPSDGWEVHT
jgi:hypothetical protein